MVEVYWVLKKAWEINKQKQQKKTLGLSALKGEIYEMSQEGKKKKKKKGKENMLQREIKMQAKPENYVRSQIINGF